MSYSKHYKFIFETNNKLKKAQSSILVLFLIIKDSPYNHRPQFVFPDRIDHL